jgi:outer membrane immunogenic protein
VEETMAKAALVAALIAAVFGCRNASAADYLPYSPPAPSGKPYWQGPYLGVNLGYQWGDVSRSRANPSGVAGGVQGGYSWQIEQFVFGAEADIQGSAADDTFASWKFSNPWFGTVRARGGVAISNVLLYGTVGVAYGSLTMQNALNGVSESHTGLGWAGGAGAEFALTSNWTAKAEYLYVDLDSTGTS